MKKITYFLDYPYKNFQPMEEFQHLEYPKFGYHWLVTCQFGNLQTYSYLVLNCPDNLTPKEHVLEHAQNLQSKLEALQGLEITVEVEEIEDPKEIVGYTYFEKGTRYIFYEIIIHQTNSTKIEKYYSFVPESYTERTKEYIFSLLYRLDIITFRATLNDSNDLYTFDLSIDLEGKTFELIRKNQNLKVLTLKINY